MTRLMKSRSGSSGYLKTMIIAATDRLDRQQCLFQARHRRRKHKLASREGDRPISRLFSIDPVGILKAWTMKVRTKSARMTATQIDSKYSRAVDLR